MVDDPPQNNQKRQPEQVRSTHSKEGLQNTGYSWAPPAPLAEERVHLREKEGDGAGRQDKQAIGGVLPEQSREAAIPLVRSRSGTDGGSSPQSMPETPRSPAHAAGHGHEESAPRTRKSRKEEVPVRPLQKRVQTGRTLLGTPPLSPLTRPEHGAPADRASPDKATIRGAAERRPPTPVAKRTLLGNPSPVPTSSEQDGGSPKASPKKTLLGAPAPWQPTADGATRETAGSSNSGPPGPVVVASTGEAVAQESPATDASPPSANDASRSPREVGSSPGPVSSRRRMEIAEAAEGQLRESELPVPSEDFDPEILRRLGDLDEAIKSSRRAPIFDIESPGSVPHPSALPGDPESRPTNELPTVGRYQVLARLKSGGMGSVYMCRLSTNSGFRRLFAMKVLHAHLTEDAEAVEAFSREARILSGLHHPNIVGIVDVGSPSEPYIVLDYIEGGSLFELYRASHQGRDPRLVIAPVIEALLGLEAAHQATDESGEPLGLVHCDISPHNILVGIDGTARITDFGIAQLGAFDKQETTARGKPRYLAPERLQQLPSDPRSDIFSMGAVLYAGLTGKEPFAGDTPEESAHNVVHKNVAPPSTVGFRPPAVLDEVCLVALSKDPNDRFRSADEMASALRHVAEREGLIAESRDVGRWVKRTLAPSLAARRAAAQRGTGGFAQRKPEPPAAASPESKPHSTQRHPTLLLPADDQVPAHEAAPPPSDSAAEHTNPIPTIDEHRRDPADLLSAPSPSNKWASAVVYAALALAVAVLLWVVIFPESVRAFFQLDVDQSVGAPAASPPSTSPASTSRSEADDVVLPDISPRRSKGEQ